MMRKEKVFDSQYFSKKKINLGINEFVLKKKFNKGDFPFKYAGNVEWNPRFYFDMVWFMVFLTT